MTRMYIRTLPLFPDDTRRVLRDVGPHHPVTSRSRRVELPNQSVHIRVHGPSVTCPKHTKNNMSVVPYSETTTTETDYII